MLYVAAQKFLKVFVANETLNNCHDFTWTEIAKNKDEMLHVEKAGSLNTYHIPRSKAS